MRVKCVGGVSLKDRRRSVDLYSLEVMISNVLLLTCLRLGEAWQIEVVWTFICGA